MSHSFWPCFHYYMQSECILVYMTFQKIHLAMLTDISVICLHNKDDTKLKLIIFSGPGYHATALWYFLVSWAAGWPLTCMEGVSWTRSATIRPNQPWQRQSQGSKVDLCQKQPVLLISVDWKSTRGIREWIAVQMGTLTRKLLREWEAIS